MTFVKVIPYVTRFSLMLCVIRYLLNQCFALEIGNGNARFPYNDLRVCFALDVCERHIKMNVFSHSGILGDIIT